MKKFYKGMCLTLSAAILVSPFSTYALSKDETVYSTANSSGKINKTIVSEHLINDEKLDSITDISNLSDVKNVNGEELFTKDSDKLIWDAKGADIYYQGNSSISLPITTSVTYSLDGKEMKRKDIIGKKGHVAINIKYTNNVKSGELYTPFVVLTEATLGTKNNSNVRVSSGKVVSTGTNNIIAAISSPGLSESLGMDELKDLDEVTIEYDTTKFSKTNIYSVATSKLIDEDDLSKLDDANKIFDEVNVLNDASSALVSGTNELVNGVNSLTTGVDELNSGAKSVFDGASTIKALVDKSINSLDANLTEEEKNLISTTAVNSVNAKFTDSYKAAIAANALASVKEDDTYKYLASSKAQLEAGGILNIYSQCTGDVITTGYENICTSNIKNISNYSKVVSAMDAMEKTAQATAMSTAYKAAIETATETAIATAQNVKSMSVNTTLTSLKSLSGGLASLTTGIGTLSNGTTTLLEGSKTLQSGANTLSSGMTKFDNDGIKKIVNLVNGKLKTTTSKVKELIKLSNKYDTFTLKENGIDGNTKFITIIK